MKVIALTTCHNRRSLTLRSIRTLLKQRLPKNCNLEICIVDDNSSDGTVEAVKNEFENIKIISGNGELFWAGGMRYGWEQYVKHIDMDYLLVFNDDVDLCSSAIEILLNTAALLQKSNHSKFAISGAFKEADTGRVSYGGVVRNSKWHPLRFAKIPPNGTMQFCHTLNMNFALINKEALLSIGFLSDDFIHGKADYDFGLRLRKAGGSVVLAPSYVGECSLNSEEGTSFEKGISFKERWKRLTGIKEQAFGQRALYFKRHAGWAWPFFWVLPYISIFFRAK